MALSLTLSTEKLIQLGEVLCQHFPEMNLDEITQQIECHEGITGIKE